MRTWSILCLLLIGAAAGALLQKPLSRLLPLPAGQSAELSSVDKDSNEKKETAPRPKADKRVISVDPDIAKLLGIEIATAEPGVMPTEVQVTGTIGFNEDKLARIVPRAAGTVRRVLKNVGDQVETGEVLAILDSKDVAEAKAVYVAAKDKLSLAETTFNREDMLFNKRVSSEQDLINARRDLAQARSDARSATQSLLTLGFRDADLKRLEIEPTDLSRVDIMAPFAGEVVEKHIFTGEFLPQDREVFVVADLDVVWVHLLVSPDKLKDTAVEAPVKITDGHGLSAEAKIGYVAPSISNETRAALARVDLPNPKRSWRPGSVVEATIEGPAAPAAIVVPSAAIQTVQGQPSVFLPAVGGFRVQTIKIGRVNEQQTEIIKGLNPGDKVATGQTFALKSELEKGAGEDND
jgi:cobalt-zinc-cadmium efflux system membrane fusion protein